METIREDEDEEGMREKRRMPIIISHIEKRIFPNEGWKKMFGVKKRARRGV